MIRITGNNTRGNNNYQWMWCFIATEFDVQKIYCKFRSVTVAVSSNLYQCNNLSYIPFRHRPTSRLLHRWRHSLSSWRLWWRYLGLWWLGGGPVSSGGAGAMVTRGATPHPTEKRRTGKNKVRKERRTIKNKVTKERRTVINKVMKERRTVKNKVWKKRRIIKNKVTIARGIHNVTKNSCNTRW